MRSIHLEHLRPGEAVAAMEQCPVVFVPIGPLEWHGPHLPLGMDPLNAAAISAAVCREVGGVVYPTLYFGTERERSPGMLRNIGFGGDEWVVGMDFPANGMPSLYNEEAAFAITMRSVLDNLVRVGYKLIVLVNGHGGENHIVQLERLAAEYSAKGPARVCYTTTTFLPGDEHDYGHATRVETAIMRHLFDENVDVATLPAQGALKNLDFAIVDDLTFRGRPTPDYTVRDDPRDATPELGARCVENSVRVIGERVRKVMEAMNQ